MAIQKIGKWEFTDEEIERQLNASAKLGEAEPERPAAEIHFSLNSKIVTLVFPDGFIFGFPSSQIKELKDAPAGEIRKGHLTEGGDAIHWDNLDAHYTVMGLLLGRFGTKKWMREIGKKGGSTTSEVKKIAAQINGAKGGRPAKTESKSIRRTHHHSRPIQLSDSGAFKESSIVRAKTKAKRAATSGKSLSGRKSAAKAKPAPAKTARKHR